MNSPPDVPDEELVRLTVCTAEEVPYAVGDPPKHEREPPDLRPVEFSDDALAKRFSDEYAEDWLYCKERNLWLHWDRRVWREEMTDRVWDLARRKCRQAMRSSAGRASDIQQEYDRGGGTPGSN